mmetsp:Transcript_42539/g.96738  ORF Transcript_42539/g.96738 Transcript_42539/m.96738 type:complete len:220 (-) Transcript_42539:65-724(-)
MVVFTILFPRPGSTGGVGNRKSELARDLCLQALDQGALPGSGGPAHHHCVVPPLENGRGLLNHVSELVVGHIHIVVDDHLIPEPRAVSVIHGGHHVIHTPDARIALRPFHQSVFIRRGDKYVSCIDSTALQPISGMQVHVQEAALVLGHHILNGLPRRAVLVSVQRDAGGEVSRIHVPTQLLRGGKDEILPVHLSVLGRACGVADWVLELARVLLLQLG